MIQLDRRQGVFKQTFEQFGPPRVNARIAKARQMMSKHAALLSRIEQQFGVPGAVVISIWGLETDFGAGMGKHPVVRAVATLAHDCRRPEMFQRELMSALTIINRGDMTNAQLLGAWAGEIGQTQFLPSSYVKFAVDFDGNGRRDLIRSVPDALASTANYLRGYGWQRGGALAEGTPNFAVLREWNRAQVYQKTIALFAQRLSRGAVARPVPMETPCRSRLQQKQGRKNSAQEFEPDADPVKTRADVRPRRADALPVRAAPE